MKLNKAVSGIVVILLLLSLAGNFFQYKYCKKEVAIETVVHRDTIIRVDTIVRNVRYDSIILYPKPVHIDTINRIQIYRDTIYHSLGWIEREEIVHGDLLSKGIEFEFNVSEYYRTRTITNTITKTVQNDLLYWTAGLSYNRITGIHPSIGASYIFRNHRNIINVTYSFDNRIEVTAGFPISK